jgi:hypothetical protein
MSHKWELFWLAILLWALIRFVPAAIASRKPQATDRIVRWIKPTRLVTRYAAFALILAAIVFASRGVFLALVLVCIVSDALIDLANWAKRKINPDSPLTPDTGWWPPKPY